MFCRCIVNDLIEQRLRNGRGHSTLMVMAVKSAMAMGVAINGFDFFH